MIKKSYILKSDSGLSSRISASLVSYANRFNSQIILYYNGEEANLKSIMNVMALVIRNNEGFDISFSGEDELEASESLNQYMLNLGII